MWSLIKHEIKYDMDLIMASSLLVVIIFIGTISLEVLNGIHIVPGIPYLFIISLQFILISRRQSEKRARIQRMLPVPVREVGMARCLFQLCLWAVVLFLFTIQALFRIDWAQDSMIVRRFLFLASMLWLANGAICVTVDIWYDAPGRHRTLRHIILIPLWVIVLAAGILYSDGSAVEVSGNSFPAVLIQLRTPLANPGINVLLGSILCVWSVILYARRRSYLQ